MNKERFEELLCQLVDGKLSAAETDELVRLAENDPNRQEEIQRQLETSEMIALAEDQVRHSALFVSAVRNHLAKPAHVRPKTRSRVLATTNPSKEASTNHTKLMKLTLPLHALWLVVAVGAYLFGTKRPEDTNATSKSSAQNSSILDRGGSSSVLPSPSNGSAKATAGNRTQMDSRSSGTLSDAALEDLVKQASSPNPVVRAQATATLLALLNSDNAPQILAAMNENGADDDQMGMVVYAWGALDGQAAMAFADEIGKNMNDEEKHGYKSQVVKGWASSDPDKAKAWVAELDDNRATSGYRWSLVSGMADGSVEIAAAYALERAEAEDRGAPRYMDMITERMLDQSSVTESAGWAEALPEGGIKTAALRRVATDFVDENPEGAAAWSETMVDSEHGPRVIGEVSDEWAERDAPAAVAWLETLPEGEAKAAGMRAALTEWVKRGDPMAASEYLADMPASDLRDHAVGGFATTLSRSDPSAAVTWAETIQDEEVRQEALHGAARAWLQQDPNSANEWLQNNNLSEELMQSITRQGRGAGADPFGDAEAKSIEIRER